MNEKISPEEHKRQIEAYQEVSPRYKTYAGVLKNVLEDACKASFPEAFVQSRPKSISSFAEKVVRKYPKYKDPVNQFTDLCGARVIVQTLEQVEAVKQFIEANFLISEKDEKGLNLGEDRFGYRDMHYIVQFRPDRFDLFGIGSSERTAIGTFKAEVQVRTWLQHAWADTLHDRVYKTPLTLSADVKRTGNLLAALMEEGDRNYDGIVHELDGMLANYTSFASKEDVQREIEIQELILANEPEPKKKVGLALKMARLRAARGEYAQVVEILSPYENAENAENANPALLLLELGHARCKHHRATPSAEGYRQGLACLEKALALFGNKEIRVVPDLRKREGLHARALALLAWALEVVRERRREAGAYWHRAHEREPGNPYYLAGMLGFEIEMERNIALTNVLRATLQQAVGTCRSHAANGIELPYAYFTAGRLSLLLEQVSDALGYYARGIRYASAARHCFPPDVLDAEREWLTRFLDLENLPAQYRWVLELFELAHGESDGADGVLHASPKALVVAGGAASVGAEDLERVRPLIETALSPHKGVVLAGGTRVGIPGCVGEVADALGSRKEKGFKVIGYRPRSLPDTAPRDERYDDLKTCGDSGFSPEQIMAYWRDLRKAGIRSHEVLCIGFGGGEISRDEYYIALAMGATVAIASLKPGDAADQVLGDPLWRDVTQLLPLPLDSATVRALMVPSALALENEKEVVEKMAQSLHENYLAQSTGKLLPSMRPWPRPGSGEEPSKYLAETYQRASREQARYTVQILEACGFEVRPAGDPAHPVVLADFTDDDIEYMAELEHGRWTAERLRDGWRPGLRDDGRKHHNCLVPWSKLADGPEGVKRYDRESVRKFPEVLAKAGLEVRRVVRRTGRR